ncbi:MAG: bifunctional methylenetetrahydrofolate dehydrogenase/methenyltetrahydrofolate cyclohydrolase FolD [Rhodospirillales bacterium]|nr:bifunctional methylenetetrahydrofolate dehydrogenase/methenyltetrahydrofolate cyclohydrolase FolD [Rhodospirillales bacterium]
MTAATIIDGKLLAGTLRKAVRGEVARLSRTERLTPGLAVVLVGDDPASNIYVRSKAQQTEEVGMKSFVHRLPADVREGELLTLIQGLNNDHRVHGILVQLPLPSHVRSDVVLQSVDPEKDVDGFHVVNAGRLAAGIDGAMVPCTPSGCLQIIKSIRPHLGAQQALIVGRSNIVGKPMALLLLAEDCTVTIAHSRTADLPSACRQADILIAAVGKPHLIRGTWIKPGAVVVDVGINRVTDASGKTRLLGDVAFAEAVGVAGAITPVPGGVGPMTVACLLRNTLIAACRSRRIDIPDLYLTHAAMRNCEF